ncbi:hypothetical protein LSAT2_026548 [Lamellibrachia satsuma]|nr:hypothetical protein LSAT2_026548 [Lamellibrachia satsuma]
MVHFPVHHYRKRSQLIRVQRQTTVSQRLLQLPTQMLDANLAPGHQDDIVHKGQVKDAYKSSFSSSLCLDMYRIPSDNREASSLWKTLTK